MHTRAATRAEISDIMRHRWTELTGKAGVVHAHPLTIEFILNEEIVTVQVLVQPQYAEISQMLQKEIKRTEKLEILADQLAQAVKRSLS